VSQTDDSIKPIANHTAWQCDHDQLKIKPYVVDLTKTKTQN